MTSTLQKESEKTKEQLQDTAIMRIQKNITSLIHIVRNQQVIMDSDLAMLYQIETKVFNQAVKRNINRFPDSFRFQLTKEEFVSLRSQVVTLNENNGRGTHRKYLPYVFTEQGIAMLSAVLKSDTAIQVSINIMNTFVEMRHFISNNTLLFEHISKLELKQLEYQKQSEEKFEQIFDYISGHMETHQKVFFHGQIYDAFSLIVTLIRKAEKDIKLIDGYVDIETLNFLAKKIKDVTVTIYTHQKTKLSDFDVARFNVQYPFLEVKYTNIFHDRFLIIDNTTVYHIGASLKDAGKKTFGISHIHDANIIQSILQRLEAEV